MSKIRKNIDFSNSCFIAILFFLIFLVYFKSLSHPFIHDDLAFIVYNPQIASFDLPSIFLKPATPVSGHTLINAYYRPVLELIYRLEYNFFQLDPMGYHFLNILIHFFNSFFVFRIGSLLLKRYAQVLPVSPREIGYLLAIIFAIHPVQAEAVNCISGISNLLCAFFILISFESYLRYREKKEKRFSRYLLSLAFCFMGMLTKEQAVIIPLLIGFYEWIYSPVQETKGLSVDKFTAGQRGGNERAQAFSRVLSVAGYFFVLFVYGGVRHLIIGKSAVPFLRFDQEFWLRILSIPRTLLMYARILLAPYDLHYYRSTDILQPSLPGIVIFLAVIFLLGTGIKKMDAFSRKLFIFLFGWFLITLLPVLNIVPLVNEYSYILTSDHFLYLPLLGIAMVVLIFLFRSIKTEWFQRNSLVYPLLVFGMVCALALLTFIQGRYYRSEVDLFENTLSYEPNFGRGRILLAKAYYIEGNYSQAIEENQKAIKIMRGYVDKVQDGRVRSFYLGFVKGAYFDLAHSFEALEDYPGALENYFQAIQIDPMDEVLHNNVGIIYMKMGKINKAIEFFQKSFNLKKNPMAQQNLSQAMRLREQSKQP